ncbi:hypothetical protein GCM10009557_28130 [Virgisporangium ochraceum]
MSSTDILIITASREEYDAARSAVDVARWEQRGGGAVPSHLWGEYRANDGRVLSVALARPTRGGGRSLAPLATSLVGEVHPTCLAMCGTCAGNPADTAPGDVVVAEVAYEWDEGLQLGTALIGDHRQFPLHPEWVRAAQDFNPAGLPSHGPASTDEALVWLLERLHRGQEPRDHPARKRYFPVGTWSERLARWEADGLIDHHGTAVGLTPVGRAMVERRLYDDVDAPRSLPFAVHVAPMASGSAVMSDGGVWDSLRGMGMRRIGAVDLEAATIATVAHELRVPFWLVAKGVADHADAGPEDRYRTFAARASAEVLFDLLVSLRLPAASRPKVDVRPAVGARPTDLRNALIDALLQLPAMAALSRRVLVVDLIRRELPGFPDVTEQPVARMHMASLVTACLDHPGALEVLAETVALVDPDTHASQKIRTLIDGATVAQRLSPRLLEAGRDLLRRADRDLDLDLPTLLGLDPESSSEDEFDLRAGQRTEPGEVPPVLRLIVEATAEVGGPVRAEMSAWVDRVAHQLGLKNEVDAYRSAISGAGARAAPPEVEQPAPAVLGGVPLRSPRFVGREALLDQVRVELGRQSPLALALIGIGGVGKTQLAIEYVYRNVGSYDLVWWVPSGGRDEVVASLARLADHLQVSRGSSGRDAADAATRALLATSERWLLVFDDVGSPDEVDEFVPVGGGHVLVTSRDPEWASRVLALHVDVFERAESVSLLRRYAERLPAPDAARVAEALGDLPFALAPAASFLAESGMPVDEYLRHLGEADERQTAYGFSPVRAVWQISIDALARHSLDALRLLQVCSMLETQQVPWDLFDTPLHLWTPELTHLQTDRIAFNRALRVISRYSLCRLDHRLSAIELTRTAQFVVWEAIDDEQLPALHHDAEALVAARPELGITVRPAPDRPADVDAGSVELTTSVRRLLAADDPQAVARLRSLVGSVDGDTAARLDSEFAFLLDPLPELDATPGRLAWISGIWTALSAGNGYEFRAPEPDDSPVATDQPVAPEHPADTATEPTVEAETPLEESFLRLLRRICRVSTPVADATVRTLRGQAAGPQYGHNLRVTGSALADDEVTVSLLFRCGTGELTVDDVGTALLNAQHRYADGGLDQFVVVAPHADPSAELTALVHRMNRRQEHRFDIQVWGPSEGVERLFALEPPVHRTVYGRPPATGPDGAREWAEKVGAAVRLPDPWPRYLRNTSMHCLGGEVWEHFAALLDDHVEPKLSDDKGAVLEVPLGTAVRDWLSSDGNRSLLLLAEFGEGKSFFTYWLSCRLAAEFLRNPRTGYLPLRLALRDLRQAGGGQELVERRLKHLGTSLAEWHELSRRYRTVVVLDGFDEMSARMDPEAFRRNVTLLESCYEYLDRSKVLITSRTHFFESPRERERFLDRVGRPQTVRIAPIPRARSEAYLHAHAVAIQAEDKLRRLKTLYDPIGLAGKPLFLQMIKETLPELPGDRFDELVLYRTYVERSLRRKIADLEDPGAEVLREELIPNLQGILELIATELHVTDQGYVSLKAVAGQHDLHRMLWQMAGSAGASPAAASSDDARARIGIRSLLKPVAAADHHVWPVEFFHRSMREYFVACAIVRRLREGVPDDDRAWREVPLPPEVINFAVLLMRDDPGTDFPAVLLAAVRSAETGRDNGCVGGNALSLLYGLTGRLPTGSWAGLDLDYAYLPGADLSGMSFRGSRLRHANLDNTTLDRADFTNADLTGVRLEETAAVRALAPVPGAAGVYCAYGDGTLREWRFGGPRQLTTHILRSDLPTDVTAIAVGPYGDIVTFARGTVSILVGSANGWRPVSTFQPRPQVRFFAGYRGDIVICADIDGETRAMRYDPAGREVRAAVPVAADDPLAASVSGTFVVSRSTGPPADRERTVNLPDARAATVDARDLGDGRILIVAGFLDGTMTCWLRSGTGPLERLWSHTFHAGPVASVRFVGDGFVVSGGADRSILIFPLAPDLSVGPRVAGEREAQMLRRLVDRQRSGGQVRQYPVEGGGHGLP